MTLQTPAPKKPDINMASVPTRTLELIYKQTSDDLQALYEGIIDEAIEADLQRLNYSAFYWLYLWSEA